MNDVDEAKRRVSQLSKADAVVLLQREYGYGLNTARDLVDRWHRQIAIEKLTTKVTADFRQIDEAARAVESDDRYILQQFAEVYKDLAELCNIVRGLV